MNHLDYLHQLCFLNNSTYKIVAWSRFSKTSEIIWENVININMNVPFFCFVDIPLRLILTKVDQLQLCRFPGNLSGIFESRQMDHKVQLAIKNFSLQDCQVLPIANYVQGFEQNITQDVLALLTIDTILQEAISYIKNETQE